MPACHPLKKDFCASYSQSCLRMAQAPALQQQEMYMLMLCFVLLRTHCTAAQADRPGHLVADSLAAL